MMAPLFAEFAQRVLNEESDIVKIEEPEMVTRTYLSQEALTKAMPRRNV